MKSYFYSICCVESDAESINAMTEQAKPVSLATIQRHCWMDNWARDNGYVTGHGRKKGLRLSDDIYVSYFKSHYRGQPCYYIEHSRIEHIFLPVNRNPTLAA